MQSATSTFYPPRPWPTGTCATAIARRLPERGHHRDLRPARRAPLDHQDGGQSLLLPQAGPLRAHLPPL
eukprot:13993357-Heterocapsa_arctica.AAC.1